MPVPCVRCFVALTKWHPEQKNTKGEDVPVPVCMEKKHSHAVKCARCNQVGNKCVPIPASDMWAYTRLMDVIANAPAGRGDFKNNEEVKEARRAALALEHIKPAPQQANGATSSRKRRRSSPSPSPEGSVHLMEEGPQTEHRAAEEQVEIWQRHRQHYLELGRQRLDFEQQRLGLEQRRLKVEEQRLELEQRRFKSWQRFKREKYLLSIDTNNGVWAMASTVHAGAQTFHTEELPERVGQRLKPSWVVEEEEEEETKCKEGKDSA